MEPLMLYDDPLEIIERSLRDVIHDVLSSKYGPNWHEDESAGLGSEWVKELEGKKKESEGVLKPEIVYDLPIAYAEFSELGELLQKNEELFRQVFDHWDTFMAYCRTAENLRNIAKHHRDLIPSQHYLLNGIAGEIENSINLWRICGNPSVKKIRFEFADHLALEGREDSEILAESVKCVRTWKESFLEAAKRSGLRVDGFVVEENEYQCSLRGQHLLMQIRTNPDAKQNSAINDKPYKNINGVLVVGSGFRGSLEALLGSMGRAYLHLAYELDETIDLARLEKWSSERAGLNPRSKEAFNQELTEVEYSFLGGKIRVGAWKYAVSLGMGGSRLSVTSDCEEGFWRAHVFLDHRKLLGFMLGSITPKAMMHLFNLSRKPFRNPDRENER